MRSRREGGRKGRGGVWEGRRKEWKKEDVKCEKDEKKERLREKGGDRKK